MRADVVHRDVTARGVRLRIAEAGDGPPAVFVHGLFADHRTWSGVVDELVDGFHCIAPDLPGFGESEKPPVSRYAYGIPAFTEAIADLYAGLGLGRAALIGHALGGAVALTVAARHPELVSRLVLVDAVCYEAHPDWTRRVAAVPVLGALVFRQLWSRPLFRASTRGASRAPARAPSPHADEYFDAFNTPPARASALATLHSTGDTRSVVADLTRIGAPTLVIWGRHDALHPASQGQRLAREIRGGFALLDAGHAPQEERPVEVAETIRRFLMDERPSRA